MSLIKDVEDIPRIICNKKQASQAVKGHPIFIPDADHDYISDEIEPRDHIAYEI